VAKHPPTSPVSPVAVRTRRAYFDCKFGQLHVRTAFPTTGGFDEQVTLLCLHPSDGSSRTFLRFMPEIAPQRSVYAPDLPGFGESDPTPDGGAEGVPNAVPDGAANNKVPNLTIADGARAVSDLANDLRLRRVDLLGVGLGAAVALELAAQRVDLVRRLVLMRVPPMDRIPAVKQESLILRIKLGAADDTQWSKGALPNARFVELHDYAADLFDAAPRTLAKQIETFLDG
jgi:pimeloyl-ACP methyl ester carboxylesterase